MPAAGGDITITPLIHSSIQIEHAGKVIQVDPWSRLDLARYKKADLILITDDPIHHFDLAAIQALRKPGAPVVIPEVNKAKFPDGIIMANGEKATEGGITVEAIPAYDIIPGAPAHPKGKSNGYVITLGGARIYVAGVTECVAEVRALKSIDVAFVPLNIPLGRMTPAAAAECVKAIAPKIVYPYHYDQVLVAKLGNPNATAEGPAGGLTIAQSLQAFKDALKGATDRSPRRELVPGRCPVGCEGPAEVIHGLRGLHRLRYETSGAGREAAESQCADAPGVRGLIALSTRQIPGMAEASLNPAVLAFTTALALVTGLVFGLVPAIAVMRGNTNTLLKEDTARGSAGRGTGVTRATLVIAETALALVLLVGAGLLIKSFARLQDVNPGLLAGQRADRAAGAAGDALSGPGGARARSGRGSSTRCARCPA